MTEHSPTYATIAAGYWPDTWPVPADGRRQ